MFEGDLAAVSQRSIDAEVALRTALKPASTAVRHRAGKRPTTPTTTLLR
jgi:hypothetical protein